MQHSSQALKAPPEWGRSCLSSTGALRSGHVLGRDTMLPVRFRLRRVSSRLARHELAAVQGHSLHLSKHHSTTIQLSFANMLAVQSTSTNKTVTPNILPCTIKHSGPVSADSRYWNPSTEQDGTSTAFFRGRKLRGKKLALPAAYQGVVLQKTDKKVVAKPVMPQPGVEADDVDAPKEIDTMIMEQQATFADVMVWDHEAVPGGDDVYVKGMEEWIGFAEAVCSSFLWCALALMIADSIHHCRCIPMRTRNRRLLLERNLQTNSNIKIPQMGSMPIACTVCRDQHSGSTADRRAGHHLSPTPVSPYFSATNLIAGTDDLILKPIHILPPKSVKQDRPMIAHGCCIQRASSHDLRVDNPSSNSHKMACFTLHQTPP